MKLFLALTLLASFTAGRPQGNSQDDFGLGSNNQGFGDSIPSFRDGNPGFRDGNPGFRDDNPGFRDGNPGFRDNTPGFVGGSPNFDNRPSFGGGNPSSGNDETHKNKPSPTRENNGNLGKNRPDRVVVIGSPTFIEPVTTPSIIIKEPTNRGGKIVIDDRQTRPIPNDRIVSPIIVDDSQNAPLCRASGYKRLSYQECRRIRKALPNDAQLIDTLGC
ncbi:hypothetical protein CDD82_60 [Ophiocordyceps australis]|uniref:Uncharacterized protein n=1 Tax=Ophiocordyceps australis TaxID=1399860 RepID=A0A2C5Y6K5_9HYPO|nr:hypothetical protein CDD82_60 [Ophiocordyceps australis]